MSEFSAYPLEPTLTIQIDYDGLDSIRLMLMENISFNEAVIQCGNRAWCASWPSTCTARSDILTASDSTLLGVFTNGRKAPRHELAKLLLVLRAVKAGLEDYA